MLTPSVFGKDFFEDSVDKSDTILQRINLLDEYQKNAVLALIDYFNQNKNQ